MDASKLISDVIRRLGGTRDSRTAAPDPAPAPTAPPMPSTSSIAIPVTESMASAPVAAIHYEDMGRWPRTFSPQIIVAVWEGVQVIWSDDLSKGGPPYQTGQVAPEVVRNTIERFQGNALFDHPARFWCRVGPEMSHTTIAIAQGPRRVNMTAPVPLIDKLAAEGAQHFREIWSELWESLLDLRPLPGHPAGSLEFRVQYLPADPGGE